MNRIRPSSLLAAVAGTATRLRYGRWSKEGLTGRENRFFTLDGTLYFSSSFSDDEAATSSSVRENLPGSDRGLALCRKNVFDIELDFVNKILHT